MGKLDFINSSSKLLIKVGLFTVRLFFYLLLYVFGCDFWIFPNLNNDKLGVIESFKPFYSFERRKNDTLLYFLFRLAIATTVVYSCWTIYNEPQLIDEFYIHLGEIYHDVLGWGNEKIINYHNGTNALTTFDKADKYRKLIEDEGLV